MASKYKSRTVGSLIKSKDPLKPNYIQIDKRLEQPLVLQAGQTIRMESKQFKLKSLDEAEKNGKLSGEILEKLRERANNMPDFVIAELVILEEK